ncbi:MAG TPA: hypothetical protein VJ809_01975 [Pirellulales bacterium]|nr:hypothetical protein [Pirellulales bacterium]
MNRPESLNGIVSDLIRRGLPADYSNRAVAELADHHRDLLDEMQASGMSESQAAVEASRRLGDSQTLVKNVVGEYQRRYWCARWPLVTFLLVPVPTWMAAYIATALVMIGVARCLWAVGLIESRNLHVAISTAPFWFLCSVDVFLWVGIPTLLTIGLAYLAKRSALGWQWVALAACVMALSAGSVRMERVMTVDPQTLTRAADRQYRVWVSLPLIEPGWWHRTGWRRWYGGYPVQAFQFFVPLAAGGTFLFRARQLAQRAERLAIAGDDFQGGKYEHVRSA